VPDHCQRDGRTIDAWDDRVAAAAGYAAKPVMPKRRGFAPVGGPTGLGDPVTTVRGRHRRIEQGPALHAVKGVRSAEPAESRAQLTAEKHEVLTGAGAPNDAGRGVMS
jgi:hypothetical protein